MGYYVYRYMVDNKWLYIGKTIDIQRRLTQHGHDERFMNYPYASISYCELDNENDMNVTERALIKIINPELNIIDKTVGKLPLMFDVSAIEWKSAGFCRDYIPETYRKRGRPPIGDSKMTKTKKIRMEPYLFDMIVDASAKLQISQEQFIRDCIMYRLGSLDL